VVLSKFTGAAVELNDALLVNPYDVHEVGEAIHRALEMGRPNGGFGWSGCGNR
jgi:trehalose 6-phosphate synthase